MTINTILRCVLGCNQLRREEVLSCMTINTILRCYDAAKMKQLPDAGHVIWDATPPAGLAFQTHKFSLLDTVEAASRFVVFATHQRYPAINRSQSWITSGLTVATYLATLPMLVLDSDRVHFEAGLTYLGHVSGRPVFVDPSLEECSFIVGNGHCSASASVINSVLPNLALVAAHDNLRERGLVA